MRNKLSAWSLSSSHRPLIIINEKSSEVIVGTQSSTVDFKTIKTRQDHSAVSEWRDEGNSGKDLEGSWLRASAINRAAGEIGIKYLY